MTEATRITLTEKELGARLAQLIEQQLVITADIKQLKADAKFDKKKNPTGIPAAEITLIAAAAKIEAQRVFEEFEERNHLVSSKYKELFDYDN